MKYQPFLKLETFVLIGALITMGFYNFQTGLLMYATHLLLCIQKELTSLKK